jgi:hypothetical protein
MHIFEEGWRLSILERNYSCTRSVTYSLSFCAVLCEKAGEAINTRACGSKSMASLGRLRGFESNGSSSLIWYIDNIRKYRHDPRFTLELEVFNHLVPILNTDQDLSDLDLKLGENVRYDLHVLHGLAYGRLIPSIWKCWLPVPGHMYRVIIPYRSLVAWAQYHDCNWDWLRWLDITNCTLKFCLRPATS